MIEKDCHNHMVQIVLDDSLKGIYFQCIDCHKFLQPDTYISSPEPFGTMEYVKSVSLQELTDKLAKKEDPVKYDVIDRPKHYNMGEIEPIDAIEDWKLSYHLGNAVKYIARAGKKDPTKFKQDLEKARWYLSREIEKK